MSELAKPNEAFWRGVHKARTAITTLSMAERAKSKAWLKAHRSSLWDDGDVPVDSKR